MHACVCVRMRVCAHACVCTWMCVRDVTERCDFLYVCLCACVCEGGGGGVPSTRNGFPATY